MSAQLGSRD
ncbi:hypothetical protein LINPERHAP2_LOCUS11816 [Linum perenne]